MTIPTIQVRALSKFIAISFDDNGVGFEAFEDVDDGVTVPGRRTSWRDLFRIEPVGDGVRIDAFFPKAMDQQEIFILPLIGDDLPLEVAEAIGRANVALADGSPSRGHGGRPIGAQFDSGTDQNLLNTALGFARLLTDV